jgi:diguanylate cyclase (GGDEF)-like protein
MVDPAQELSDPEEERMAPGRSERVRTHAFGVRAWTLWELPRWIICYIAIVVAADVAGAALAALVGFGSVQSLALFGALLGCNAATVEFTKRAGENAGVIKDVHGVWELPVAILLPPVYAFVMPVIRLALVQWRIRRIPIHRRVLTAAVIGLSYGAASLVFHGLTGQALGSTVAPVHNAAGWILATAAAGLVQWAINAGLVIPAVKGTDPTVTLRSLIAGREVVENDATELCVAVLVTLGVAISQVTILFALPFVTLLQRSFRHAYLVNASRVDSKTGLLNAGTWEREAGSEVARAVRTRTPLAVALLDVDHFKAVNDANGHLAGDKALKAIARTLTLFLREYDLVGRFGGEEFALLLPQTGPVDAYRIAERIRANIGAMPIDISDSRREPIKLTVSIGVASLGARWDTASASQLTDLLAGADSALYQAKRDGRDRVCILTENATYGTKAKPAGDFLGEEVRSDDLSLPLESAEGIAEDWRIPLQGLKGRAGRRRGGLEADDEEARLPPAPGR